MKAALQILAGFLAYAAIGAGVTFLSLFVLPGRAPGAAYALLFLTPAAAVVCGLVGIAAVFLIRQGDYREAVNWSVFAFVAVACAMAVLLRH